MYLHDLALPSPLSTTYQIVVHMHVVESSMSRARCAAARSPAAHLVRRSAHLCFFPPTQFPTEVWWTLTLIPTMGVGVLLEGTTVLIGVGSCFICIHYTLVVHLELSIA